MGDKMQPNMAYKIPVFGLAALCLATSSCGRIKKVDDFICTDWGMVCAEKGASDVCYLADGTLDVKLSNSGFKTVEEAAYALNRCKNYFSKPDERRE